MTASIVIWLVTFASCSLVGLPLLFREGWSMGELRRMARARREGRASERTRRATAIEDAKSVEPMPVESDRIGRERR